MINKNKMQMFIPSIQKLPSNNSLILPIGCGLAACAVAPTGADNATTATATKYTTNTFRQE